MRYELMKWMSVLTVVLLAAQVGGTAGVTSARASDAITAGESPALKTPKERTSYGLGVDMGRNLKRQGAEMDPEIVVRGMKDAMGGDKLLLTDEELLATMRSFADERRMKQNKDKQIATQKYMSKTEEEKTLYAVGLAMSRQLTVFNLTPAELEVVKQGLTDAGTGKGPDVDLGAYTEKINELVQARRKAQGEKLVAANRKFIDKAAREKGALKTDSGLVYLALKDGSGTSPGPADTVKVNYRGTFPDGKVFDSSSTREEPVELKMDGVIKCWNEGLQKMKTGGKAELVCPPEIAYGDSGAGDLILPYATLVFEVELLEVKK